MIDTPIINQGLNITPVFWALVPAVPLRNHGILILTIREGESKLCHNIQGALCRTVFYYPANGVS